VELENEKQSNRTVNDVRRRLGTTSKASFECYAGSTRLAWNTRDPSRRTASDILEVLLIEQISCPEHKIPTAIVPPHADTEIRRAVPVYAGAT
jgi:hypothetical protein